MTGSLAEAPEAPPAFAGFEAAARNVGFLYAAAGPLVHSLYRTRELYLTNVLRAGEAGAKQAAAAV